MNGPRRSPRLRGTALAIAFGLATLSLLSCSTDESPTPQASAAATDASPGPWTMTGEPRPPGAEDAAVMAVKIDNTQDGQVAVDKADLVTQLPVEGGLTRLAAFYQSQIPDRVGPVRSARVSDIGLVEPANAILVASGGAPITLAALNSAGVTLVDENDPAMSRDPNRSGSNNVFANLPEIRAAHAGQMPMQPYLDFGQFTGTGGTPAKEVQVTFSSVSNEGWTYRPKTATWRRQALGAFQADTLLVLTVDLADAGYDDAAGSAVPIVVSTGQGTGWLATSGRVHDVSWSKAAEDAPWRIATPAGQALQIPPGQTWISLIPRETGALTAS